MNIFEPILKAVYTTCDLSVFLLFYIFESGAYGDEIGTSPYWLTFDYQNRVCNNRNAAFSILCIAYNLKLCISCNQLIAEFGSRSVPSKHSSLVKVNARRFSEISSRGIQSIRRINDDIKRTRKHRWEIGISQGPHWCVPEFSKRGNYISVRMDEWKWMSKTTVIIPIRCF